METRFATVRVTDVHPFKPGPSVPIDLFLSVVQAGFPSPADDYVDRALDLTEWMVKDEAATCFVRVDGESMVEVGIHSGDLLVVDRGIEVKDGDIVVAALDGDLTVKRLRFKNGKCYLVAEAIGWPAIEVGDASELIVWGVVTGLARRFRP